MGLGNSRSPRVARSKARSLATSTARSAKVQAAGLEVSILLPPTRRGPGGCRTHGCLSAVLWMCCVSRGKRASSFSLALTPAVIYARWLSSAVTSSFFFPSL